MRETLTPSLQPKAGEEPRRQPHLARRAIPEAGSEDAARLKRLLWTFAFLLAVLVAPSVVGRIQYAITAAQERARLDVARENLGTLDLHQLNTANRLLAQAVVPSVVSLSASDRIVDRIGSGVIVDADGYIVTNHHVVKGIASIEVTLSDGRSGSASVIGVDPEFDLAVLKTELEGLSAATWGNSANLQAGELVWALGSPFRLPNTITQGIVSATERREIHEPSPSPRSPYTEFLQTDAAVNPGNSGGPLVNVNGEVVGINTAIVGEEFKGISFAIPSELARSTYEALRRDGHVNRGYLGVLPAKVSDRYARRLRIETQQGVLIAGMSDGTPAAKAGLELGDVILRWDGAPYSDPTLLSRAIAATPIGSAVALDVVRPTLGGSQSLSLEVTVGARPRFESQE